MKPSAPVVYQASEPGGTPSPDWPGDDDPLAAFPTEAQVAARGIVPQRRPWRGVVAVVALGLAALTAVLALMPGPRATLRRIRTSLTATDVTLVVRTPTPGWTVSAGSRGLGTTPVTVALPPGRYTLRLTHGTFERSIDVTLTSGVEEIHVLEAEPAVPAVGRLVVNSVPPGAAVAVDGVERGVTPLDVTDLAPGDHAVSVSAGGRAVTEQITIAAGASASLTVPLAPAEPEAPTVGWVTVVAPIELQVFDGDALVGSSRNRRILLVPGRRTLRLVNRAVGFETTANVVVEAGVVARVAVRVPNGSLSVNAVPWAEVLLDGKVIGETPIANYAAPLGTHELVLRNPRYPEQRRSIVISMGTPARVGVDLRQ